MRANYIVVLLFILLFLAGCSSVSVMDINSDPDKYMGKKVVVKGKVLVPIEFGSFSSFTLKSEDSSILVSSDEVPEKGTEVTVKGIVVRGVFTQHYIFAEKVSRR